MAADIYKVLRGIKGMKGEPVIIFSFARRWLRWLLLTRLKGVDTPYHTLCRLGCCLEAVGSSCRLRVRCAPR